QCAKNYIILINIHYFSEHNFDRRGGRWESLVILYVKGKLKPCDRVLTDKCSVWWCSSHVVTAYFYNNSLHLLAALKPPKSHTTAAAEDPIPERVTLLRCKAIGFQSHSQTHAK
ncbi:unnamed protein product, partial [Prunus brigantina]